MKYRLKKDLPFAKAGAEVRLVQGLAGDNNICYAIDVYPFWCPKKNFNEWIEEVKPREGWLAEDNDGGYVFYIGRKPTGHWDKTTKFIEVIE